MPIHDWTRVNPGTFHDFHNGWITHLKERLNGGLLPEHYYAMSEQHPGRVIADVLTLEVGDSPNAAYRTARRTLAIRHVSNHRVVALIEVLSPANKDRASSVHDFVEKARSALQLGCHLLVVDLFPPGPNDPRGIHGAIWEFFDPADYRPPDDKPLTLTAYAALPAPEAYVEAVAVGDALPDMPLFLEPEGYVNVPLEGTYQAAYRGLPGYWRGVLEWRQPPPA